MFGRPIADRLAEIGVPCFGPSRAAAELEASKAFCKQFMAKHGIPTARYETFTSSAAAEAWIRSPEAPERVVVKASGLAGGKGVLIPKDKEEAVQAAREMLDGGKFKDAGSTIVVEEMLEGPEASILAFCDGKHVVALPAAQDHKRAHEFDQGLNTGGMGVYCPSPLVTPELDREIMETILRPAVEGMAKDGKPFVGVLFAGLMLCKSTGPAGGLVPKVLEFNVRMGDPETQAVLPLLERDCDLLEAMLACTQGRLTPEHLRVRKGAHSAAVVAVAPGYPSSPRKGDVIKVYGPGLGYGVGEKGVGGVHGTLMFHAGTTVERRGNAMSLVTAGGRVLAVTGIAGSLEAALTKAYNGMEAVIFPGMGVRRDIAQHWFRPRSREPLRIGVLGSTNGTDLQTILDAIEEGRAGEGASAGAGEGEGEPLNARVEVVISNRASSGILSKAAKAGIPAVHIKSTGRSREQFDLEVISELESRDIDLVLLIGFMRIVSPQLTSRYKWRLVNVHPSLLPAFAGGMDTDVHEEVVRSGAEESGCTIHFVTDEVDGGQHLIQRRCSAKGETAASLKTKVQALEGAAFLDTIRLFADHRGLLAAIAQHGWDSPQVGVILAESGFEGVVIPPAARVHLGAVEAASGGNRTGGTGAAGTGASSGAGSSDREDAYAAAGVSIDRGNALVRSIAPLTRSTARPGADGEVGGFGGVFDLKSAGYKDPLLVSGTDGVGTKLLVANAAGAHGGIGIDLVAMCVNDILTQAAEPLFFLDYFATGALDVPAATQVVAGVAHACRESGCALIGGETAEMPAMYQAGHYDVAGFCVGAVDRPALLPRLAAIRSGAKLIGLPSSGVHSNGFSLVRRIVDLHGLKWGQPPPFKSSKKTLADALLEPTRLYVRQLLPMLRSAAARAGEGPILAMAHITGGGLLENLPRVLPKGTRAVVDASAWDMLPVFRWLFRPSGGSKTPAQPVATVRDMLRTFNCGIGMVVVVQEESAEQVLRDLRSRGEEGASIIGHIESSGSAGEAEVDVRGIEESLLRAYTE